VQANLVNTLLLQQSRPAQAVAVTAGQATEAARAAETVANRIARALDAIDDAVTNADCVAGKWSVQCRCRNRSSA
jgi:hypothetical protein